MEFKVLKELELPDEIFDARYHPSSDKNLIGAVTIAGDVHVIEDGELKTKLKRHHKGTSIRKIRFDKNGYCITIAKTVKVHDFVANATTHTLRKGESETSAPFYSVSPLGDFNICAGDDDGSIFVWDTRTPAGPVFTSSDCEQYISDIDSRSDARRTIVCTSGEGTLTAYDLRANKMIEPQSELFEAGFQCVKLHELTKKALVGGEDGAIYIFNQNEWAHTSGKFAIHEEARNRGRCSVDGIDVIPNTNTFMVVCSDGRLRSFTLWPHQILSETVLCKRSPLESIHINPDEAKSEFVVAGERHLNIVNYKFTDTPEDDSSDSTDDVSMENKGEEPVQDADTQPKSAAPQRDDYLNVFE